jgi:hypothetical protein
MLSDAYIEVTCDGCHEIEVVTLTATAKGWDERNVKPYLKSIGWLVDGDCHYCPECKTKPH